MDIPLKEMLEVGRRGASGGRASASSGIYDELRQRILSLELPPGTNLLRAELAKQFDVSVTPLRDALQKLEADGLVKIYPQSRTVVTRIDTDLVHDGHFLRRALETEVVRRLATDGAPETIERARLIIGVQKLIGNDDTQLRLFQELDEHFHRTLFDGIGQIAMHDLIRSRAGHLDRVRRLQRHSPEKIHAIIEGHLQILDAIEARDVNAADAAIREHLHKDPDWVDEFRNQHRDYFA
ncbi:GntR family transcriptional regulator [Puniceibacterium sp. IMCC21224]|uniref:GntR family transcriptional regulator n=1 Tax=Puniceibacterium sp. IMCC21224 TaxID=1618204 RepID=UPI00065DA5C5|nr:GntR family transcriptional regulator [Puniceibacterium sp. IMCC21224]KMK68958.1 transcriptional regulator [Puniceibacterium sp. IMCC21224]